MKFRKKSVVIDAEQWLGGSVLPLGCYIRLSEYKDVLKKCYILNMNRDTLEGTKCVSCGDWVITNANGKRYSCKPDIFEKIYERIDDVETE